MPPSIHSGKYFSLPPIVALPDLGRVRVRVYIWGFPTSSPSQSTPPFLPPTLSAPLALHRTPPSSSLLPLPPPPILALSVRFPLSLSLSLSRCLSVSQSVSQSACICVYFVCACVRVCVCVHMYVYMHLQRPGGRTRPPLHGQSDRGHHMPPRRPPQPHPNVRLSTLNP